MDLWELWNSKKTELPPIMPQMRRNGNSMAPSSPSEELMALLSMFSAMPSETTLENGIFQADTDSLTEDGDTIWLRNDSLSSGYS